MDLRDPLTLFAAWVLVPALVVAASAGLGWLLARLTGEAMGALTVPAGFLTGVTACTVLLSLGLPGKLAVALMVLAALAGLGMTARDARRARVRPRIDGAVVWPALAVAVAYGLALAPVVGTGRSAMLGYGMLGDSAVHITLVEQIAQHDASLDHPERDSFHAATRDLDLGYPLGSYAWPLFGRVLTGVGPFHLWAPLSALVLALIALVAYALLRTLLLPRALAAAAGVLVGTGYLVYAYHAQGGTKEVLMPLAVYGTTALAAQALERPLTARSLIPAVIAAAAAVSNLGAGGLAWVGPPALAVLAVLVWRARRAGSWAGLRPLLWPAALLVAIGLPVVVRTLSFFDAASGSIGPKSGEFANLLGPVPFREAWNVWIAHDYRLLDPDAPFLTDIGVWLATILGVVGVVYALVRRNVAILLTLLAGVAAVLLVTPRASIYYDAKTYVAVAPALGVATVAGLLALARRGALLRALSFAAAALLALGVLASDAYVYSGVWVTPRFRFIELDQVADRTRGQGPILVNDFEEWAAYILRDSRPWVERAFRWPDRQFRFPGNLPRERPLDFDDYRFAHIESFPLLLERKRPYDSHPPSNYALVYETARYRVWRRDGPAPREHVPLGYDGFQGPAPLECRRGEPRSTAARALFARARGDGVAVRAAVGPDEPIVAISPESWVNFKYGQLFKPPEDRAAIGGEASGAIEHIQPGRYRAWIQGSLGPGVVLYVRPVGRFGFDRVGYADNDNGVPDAWHPIGTLVAHRDVLALVAAVGRPFYKSGSQHYNVVGPVIFTREDAHTRLVDVPPARLGTLCGQRLDWLELPPARI
ncbi:MAG TPA: hypothetical protein VF545_09845 [Thermoleophilaceae bacterium]